MRVEDKDIVVWVAADYSAVYGVVHKVAVRMAAERGRSVHMAHLSVQRAQGLKDRPGQDGDLSGDHGDHAGALIDLEVLSACHVVVCTRLSTFGFVAHARHSFLSSSHLHPSRQAAARINARTWQCSGNTMKCQQLAHWQAGLVAAEPVHAAWPWTEERFRNLSCVVDAHARMHGALSPV